MCSIGRYGLEIRPDGSYLNYTSLEVGLAKAMLTTLAFLGDRVRWDWHVQLINYDDPTAPPEQVATAQAFYPLDPPPLLRR